MISVMIKRKIMKKLAIISSIFLFSAFVSKDVTKITKNTSFQAGELVKYRIHVGFITGGEAAIEVHPKLYSVNDKVCYKINASGQTTGTVGLMFSVKDLWRSYIDTSTLIPEKFYRDISEGKYRLKEKTEFNQEEGRVLVQSQKKDKDLKNEFFDIKALNTHDIVSGYYYLRNINYNKLKKGTVISLDAFFENKLYDFKVRYEGKETIKIKGTKYGAIKIIPIMPDDQELFDGESSIRIWLSDDENKIPLKAEADMFVAKVQLDLKSYSGLRHKLNIIK